MTVEEMRQIEAAAGAYAHWLAGELARQALGAVGMVAGDALANLPAAFQRILDPVRP